MHLKSTTLTQKLLTIVFSSPTKEAFLAHSMVRLSGGARRPLAAAACVPRDTVPARMAPAAAPDRAPAGPTHQHTMPRVKTPQVALAAIADRAVATPAYEIVSV